MSFNLTELEKLEALHAKASRMLNAHDGTEYRLALRDAFPAMAKALREAQEISKGRREEAFDWISAYFEAQRERDEALATNERLRAALERIANPAAIGSAFHEEAVAIARRAL